jgi:hypothetical protein
MDESLSKSAFSPRDNHTKMFGVRFVYSFSSNELSDFGRLILRKSLLNSLDMGRYSILKIVARV